MFYLKQADGSLLIGLSIFNDGHNIWVRLCHLSHPVADLRNRRPWPVTVTLHLRVCFDALMLTPFSPLPLCGTWSSHGWCCYRCKNRQKTSTDKGYYLPRIYRPFLEFTWLKCWIILQSMKLWTSLSLPILLQKFQFKKKSQYMISNTEQIKLLGTPC